MKGLLKNNYYAVLSNMKVFSIIMLLLGVFVVVMDHKIPSLIVSSYMLLGMVGFSLISIAGLRRGSTDKWSRVKLTMPVKRFAVVRSHFLSLLLWLFVGMVFAGIGAALSTILHGYSFRRNTDVFMLFVAGILISLLMGAIFFPLFYLDGGKRSGVYIILSLLCAIKISSFTNILLPVSMNTMQIILAGISILVCALFVFTLSCLLTVCIFRKKEY